MWDGIMNVNPQCLDYADEDSRSVLNGQGAMTETYGTDIGWMEVESKKVKKVERMKSRVSADKNGSVSHAN